MNYKEIKTQALKLIFFSPQYQKLNINQKINSKKIIKPCVSILSFLCIANINKTVKIK